MQKDSDYIYGVRSVIEAVQSNKEINKILIQKGMDKKLFQELKEVLANQNYHLQFVPAAKLNSITRKNHQGVIALISPIDYAKLTSLLPPLFERAKMPLLVVLDRITDVRNFGGIVRTAECMGADAIVIPEKESAYIGHDAMKTSAGALNHLPVCKEKDLLEALDYIKMSGCQIIGASEKKGKQVKTIDFDAPTALILGSEEDGINASYHEMVTKFVKIPMSGNIQSLNVGVAAGMLLYECARQRS